MFSLQDHKRFPKFVVSGRPEAAPHSIKERRLSRPAFANCIV